MTASGRLASGPTPVAPILRARHGYDQGEAWSRRARQVGGGLNGVSPDDGHVPAVQGKSAWYGVARTRYGQQLPGLLHDPGQRSTGLSLESVVPPLASERGTLPSRSWPGRLCP